MSQAIYGVEAVFEDDRVLILDGCRLSEAMDAADRFMDSAPADVVGLIVWGKGWPKCEWFRDSDGEWRRS